MDTLRAQNMETWPFFNQVSSYFNVFFTCFGCMKIALYVKFHLRVVP